MRRLAPGLPTLDETWDSIAGRGPVNVEVKADGVPWKARKRALPAATWRPMAVAVARWLGRRRLRGASDRLLLSSFDPRILGWLAVAARRVPRALIFEAVQAYPVPPLLVARALGCTAVHAEHPLVDAALVARAHAKRIAVTAWTVDAGEEMMRLRGLGVDAVVTNDPGRTRALLEGSRSGVSGDPLRC